MDSFSAEVLATPEAISAMLDDVCAFLDQEAVDARAAHHVTLILDELLTNLGTHGNCPDHPAEVRLVVHRREVSGTIVDRGVAFDLTQTPDPVLDHGIEERKVGGLGLYLIRKLTSRLEYRRTGDRNRVTFAVARGGADED
jgi:anti-sigma regulatory factor (Ser/Thr protein kinase)